MDDLTVMAPEDLDSEDKEMLSWDINDMKLPQVRTYIRICLQPLTLKPSLVTFWKEIGEGPSWVNSRPAELRLGI